MEVMLAVCVCTVQIMRRTSMDTSRGRESFENAMCLASSLWLEKKASLKS